MFLGKVECHIAVDRSDLWRVAIWNENVSVLLTNGKRDDFTHTTASVTQYTALLKSAAAIAVAASNRPNPPNMT